MAPILAIILLLNFFGSPVFADNLAWYVFWPEVPDNNHQTEGLGTSLQPANNEQFLAQLTNDAKIGGGGDVSACTSSSVGDGGSTWYWIAHIDQTVVQTKYLYDGGKSAMKMIRAVLHKGPPYEPPETFKGKRSIGKKQPLALRDDTTQSGAPRQLKFLSISESGNNNIDGRDYYKYDETAGRGVRVYVVDSGLNFASTAWESTDGRWAEIIYAEPWSKHYRGDLDNYMGHGTCMADVAVGRINGVAKRADLTAVQIANDPNEPWSNLWIYETTIDAFAKIADDIDDKGLGDKAVVHMAWAIYDTQDIPERDEPFRQTLAELFDHFDEKGVSLVVAQPNTRRYLYYPCLMGDPEDDYYVPNLITVGSAQVNDGTYSDAEVYRDDWTTIYAPRDDSRDGRQGKPGLVCAHFNGDENVHLPQGGTSHASAIVAGMMAYYKGLGLSNDDARARLLSDAYKRSDIGPDMP